MLEQKVESLEKDMVLLRNQMERLVQTVQIFAAVINVVVSKLKVTDEEIKANLASQNIKVLGNLEQGEQPGAVNGSGNGSGGLSGAADTGGAIQDAVDGPWQASDAGTDQAGDLSANSGSD